MVHLKSAEIDCFLAQALRCFEIYFIHSQGKICNSLKAVRFITVTLFPSLHLSLSMQLKKSLFSTACMGQHLFNSIWSPYSRNSEKIVMFFFFLFFFSPSLWVAPVQGSFVLPNSATRKRKDGDFRGFYLVWLMAWSLTAHTHTRLWVSIHTYALDSHGVIVTVAEIREPFKWRALLTQLIRGTPCIGKLADNAFSICVCVRERQEEVKRNGWKNK